jgi:1,4-alpha-glucan branching enzyme
MTRGGVRFSLLQPDARTVALAGSFNEWSTASHLLSRQPSGVWTIVVGLPPGEHPFMFVVDGQWVSPPVAEDYADDGFGKRNGIVVVRPDAS